MTKLSPNFCFQINPNTPSEKAFWLGFMLQSLLVDLPNMDNGVEVLRNLSAKFPEIEILKE